MKFAMIFLSTLLLIQSKCNSDQSKNKPSSSIIGCWKHAYEEQKDGSLQFFRPCDSKDWPPSRFRQFYDFKSDGTYSYLWLSPIDAHKVKTGSWSFDENAMTLSLQNADGKAEKMKITEFSPDIIKIARLAE
jgi:hypothetical protein